MPPLPVLSLPLDAGAVHRLEIRAHQAALVHSSGDLSFRLHRALARHLRLTASGLSVRLDATDECPLPSSGTLSIALGDAEVATVELGAPARCLSSRVLCPFETRYLADNGFPHPFAGSVAVETVGLGTDLHSHFAGAPRSAALVALGVELGLPYPAALLAEAGIRVSAAGEVPLASLDDAHLRRLERELHLPLDRQSTFVDMERVYRLRAPLTKPLQAFAPLLRHVAEDAALQGLRRVELSLGDIHLAARLRVAEREVPELERSSGVRLRFLLALSRHNDREWDDDLIDRLEALAGSRALVGVDFMGHETNSTHDFGPQLERIAAWAHRHRPGFVVRVHAGENPAYPENVRAVLEHLRDREVCVRIGHGLYGCDDATLEALAERGAFVEINLDSNFALNNIREAGEAPLRRYLARGVRCTLGTDGAGLYQTSLPFAVRAALLTGVTPGELGSVAAAERDYLALADGLERDRPVFQVPDDAPPRHYTEEIASRKRAARTQRDARLRAAAGDRWLESSDVDAWIAHRRLVSVAGAWLHSWQRMGEASKERVAALLDALVPSLPRERVVLVTGGTAHGVEGEVHRRAREAGVPVLAVVVGVSPSDALDPRVDRVVLLGEALHDKAPGLYRMMKAHDGLCLFLGGGNVVHDEIRAAANLRLRYLALAGVDGASGEAAREQTNRAFATAADVLRRLDDLEYFRAAHEPFWHLGRNPTVDAAIFRVSAGPLGPEVLLVRRDEDAPAEPGSWALPGGFVATDAPRGEPWSEGREAPEPACRRELLEETGLALPPELPLTLVGRFEGGQRDPRDTPSAWSCTWLYAALVPPSVASQAIAGGDDACDARWWPLAALPRRLAFDHARLLSEARAVLGV